MALDRFDLARAELALGGVQLDGLTLSARREHNGSVNLAKLLGPGRGTAAMTAAETLTETAQGAAPVGSPAPGAGQPATWRFSLARGVLHDAAIQVEDLAGSRPVRFDLAPLNLTLTGLGPDLTQACQIELDSGFGRKGRFTLSGTAIGSPASAALAIDASALDLSVFEPYVAASLNTTIVSAALSTRGKLDVALPAGAAMALHYFGDATLGRVRMLDKVSADEFLRWESLNASRFDLTLGAEAPSLSVGALALSNFYTRLIVNANGTMNLQDIVVKENQAPTSLTRAAPSGTATRAPAPATPASDAASPATAPPAIAIGAITLQGGRVNYTDNFIKPNFSADVTDIAGSAGAFGTATTVPAELTLAGKLDRTAPIAIEGRINPLVPVAFVDIKAKADGVELTQLTPYSAKYAGYPIVKGLLNVDVHYHLDQGKLNADNHLFIDQLTFGPKIESPTATKLPVTLAIALLKNSRGEIDVRIPVSGSLDDPQFSLGGVIFQAFVNAIVGAVTSPFRLLASAFGGGGEELSYAEFAPGSAALAPDANQRLETIAKALADRPALQLDIAGRVDPELDRPGLREALLVERLSRPSWPNCATRATRSIPTRSRWRPRKPTATWSRSTSRLTSRSRATCWASPSRCRRRRCGSCC